MDIKITMLNVRDGDAIVVALKKTASEQLLMLIDGGHAGDASATIKVLQEAATLSGKTGPDLVICTHYDADHIGGLQKIVEHFKESIREVWIHKPGIILNALRLAEEIQISRVHLTEATGDAAILKNKLFSDMLYPEGEIIIESYDQMKKLIDYLDKAGIKTVEPFTGQSFKGWPEVRVLGPTKEFYQSRLDSIIDPKKLFLEEIEELRQEKSLLQEKSNLLLQPIAERILDPCGVLDANPGKKKVTAVNQVSVIMEITVGNNKYLFTGDASIESFEAIPDYKKALKNLHWLKVPHHGSRNNSSAGLIDIMKPKFADISGNSHFDNEVQGCLERKGTKVRSTKEAQAHLLFPYSF